MSGRLHAVALVGMDGAGKTTQAEAIRRHLARRSIRVVVVHPYGRKVLRIHPPRGPRRGPARRVAALWDLLEIGAYLWLAFLRAGLVAARPGARHVWIVGDRSFDDLVAKHERQHDLPGWLLGAARRLAPHFDRTIWLDVDPAVARLRDAEFEPEYYEACRAAYARLAGTAGWTVLSPNGDDPHAVFGEVRRLLDLPPEPWAV